MSENVDGNVVSSAHRSFRQDDAEASPGADHRRGHSRHILLEGDKMITLEDEPERFVTFAD